MSLHWSKRILLRDAIWWHAPKSHDAFSRQVAPDVCTCSLIFYEKWRHFRFPQKLFLMLVKLHKEGRNLLFYLIRVAVNTSPAHVFMSWYANELRDTMLNVSKSLSQKTQLHFHTRHHTARLHSEHRRSTLASSFILCHTGSIHLRRIQLSKYNVCFKY